MALQMRCNVYHDERIIPNKWLYHGLLFVPVEKESQVLKFLNAARLQTGCKSVVHFHALRDTVIENQLAQEWIGLFCNELATLTFFYFMGVDYTKLARKLWPSHRGDKIYNKFFQIGLYSAIKWFFLNEYAGFSRVTVHKVFSHVKDRLPEDTFSTRPIADIAFRSINKDKEIHFECSEICEISDDHRLTSDEAEKCQVIQYVDLIVGGISQIFDFTSKHLGKCIVADVLCNSNLPFEIMYSDKPKFRSAYYKKYAIAFFPREKIPEIDILERTISTEKSQFYHYRYPEYLKKIQGSLFS